MIIDCHGHYTTTPRQHAAFRDSQLAWVADPSGARPSPAPIGDDEIRASIEENQLRVLRERGIDLTILSPRALGMEHHVAEPDIARDWARASNDLVHRVTRMFPKHFAGVCQLPQTADGSLDAAVAELDRCVVELGFVGCNLNPDPSGGRWTSPPLTDPAWYPLYEKMVQLEVPAMIHVSASCTPSVHATGAHYLNGDTTVFMQLVEGDLFRDFSTLRLVIPHGGGAVPYHWGRYRGLAARFGRPPLVEHLMANVFFDTCVYHQAGIDLLFEVIDAGNILFASEMLGAVPNVLDPETGHHFDDTKRYVDAVELTDEDRRRVFESNARGVYPRLERMLQPRSTREV
jgi:4-oxalmesaconate hydratase